MSIKKLFVIAAFVFAGGSLVRADYRETPKGPEQALQTTRYGGVSIATMSFSSSNVLLWGPDSGPSPLSTTPGGCGVINWIHVTTANAASAPTDFLSIRSTGTFASTTTVSAGIGANGDYSTSLEVYRVQVGTSVGTGGGYANQWTTLSQTGFDYVFPDPILLCNGAMIKFSANTFGPVVVGYTKQK